MTVKNLKVGYPIYHIKGRGAYGCKNDIITHITKMNNGEYSIVYHNFKSGMNGEYYAYENEEVELLEHILSFFEKIKIEIKAFIYRLRIVW